jgi:Spy/CpxP family protein refolding chaperone
MRRTTTLLALTALWMGAAVAQPPDPPGGGGGPGFRHETPAQRMEKLATLLDLTDAQKPQVQAVLDEEHAKMKAARDAAEASGTRPTFDQMKAEHEQVKQDTIAKLTPILTAAQLKKFQVLMEGPGGPH